MIDDFIDRKHGRKAVVYDLPELKEILEETYGVIVYQEQVMQIANRLAGYSLGDADLLRRAMGKKKVEEMAKQRERFVEGAARARLPAEEGREDLRPDGAVRRLRLQQVALGRLRLPGLRHRLPQGPLPGRVHGRAADLGNRQHRQGGEVHQRVPRTWASRCCRRTSTPATGASRPDGEAIRFGLGAIKNVGQNAVESIIARRARELGRFTSLYQFCERVDLAAVNRRMIESLIKAGAMDSLGGTRAQLFAVVEGAMEAGQRVWKDRASGQTGLFAAMAEADGDARPAAAQRARLDRPGEARRRKGDARLLRHRPSAGPVSGQGDGTRHARQSMLEGLAKGAEVALCGILTGIAAQAQPGRQALGRDAARRPHRLRRSDGLRHPIRAAARIS